MRSLRRRSGTTIRPCFPYFQTDHSSASCPLALQRVPAYRRDDSLTINVYWQSLTWARVVGLFRRGYKQCRWGLDSSAVTGCPVSGETATRETTGAAQKRSRCSDRCGSHATQLRRSRNLKTSLVDCRCHGRRHRPRPKSRFFQYPHATASRIGKSIFRHVR